MSTKKRSGISLKRLFTLRFLILTIALSLLASCSSALYLTKGEAAPGEITGNYRLYLYGCRNPDDIENMVLLVNMAAPYRINMFVPDTSYRVEENVPGPDALSEAKRFLSCSFHDTGRSVLRRIVDRQGNTVAFELKPLFSPLEMGTDEVLQTNYFLRGNVLTVDIKLDPTVERTRMYNSPMEESHGD